MLVLTRKKDEAIFIGPDIKITVVEIRDGYKVRLGIEAPDCVGIKRSEIVAECDEIAEKMQAKKARRLGGRT